jgi:hypothetical protein
MFTIYAGNTTPTHIPNGEPGNEPIVICPRSDGGDAHLPLRLLSYSVKF